MKYIVTKEIKSETQVFWIIYLQDFALLVLWAMLCFMLKGRVHDSLGVFYGIFSTAVGIGLMLPSSVNPKRRNYQSIALYMIRPRNVYRFFQEGKDEEKRIETHKRRTTKLKV